MGPVEMSKRTHLWLRLAAIAVIGVAAYVPRGMSNPPASAASHAPMPESTVIQASVAQR